MQELTPQQITLFLSAVRDIARNIKSLELTLEKKLDEIGNVLDWIEGRLDPNGENDDVVPEQ